MADSPADHGAVGFDRLGNARHGHRSRSSRECILAQLGQIEADFSNSEVRILDCLGKTLVGIPHRLLHDVIQPRLELAQIDRIGSGHPVGNVVQPDRSACIGPDKGDVVSNCAAIAHGRIVGIRILHGYDRAAGQVVVDRFDIRCVLRHVLVRLEKLASVDGLGGIRGKRPCRHIGNRYGSPAGTYECRSIGRHIAGRGAVRIRNVSDRYVGELDLDIRNIRRIRFDAGIEVYDVAFVDGNPVVDRRDVALVHGDPVIDCGDISFVYSDPVVDCSDVALVYGDPIVDRGNISFIGRDTSVEIDNIALVDGYTTIQIGDIAFVHRDPPVEIGNVVLVLGYPSVELTHGHLDIANVRLEIGYRRRIVGNIGFVLRYPSIKRRNCLIGCKKLGSIDGIGRGRIQGARCDIGDRGATSAAQRHTRLGGIVILHGCVLQRRDIALVCGDPSVYCRDFTLVHGNTTIDSGNVSLIDGHASIECGDIIGIGAHCLVGGKQLRPVYRIARTG